VSSCAIPIRPVLRWHGGKWVLAPWILAHFPPHRVYVEPFGGAASVLLRKSRSYAEVYNDLDCDVVALFRVLRDDVAARALVSWVRLTPFARDEFQSAYDVADDDMERARRLLIRSFMGFGSNGHARKTGFRSNCNRPSTTPAHDWAHYPDCLLRIVDRVRGVVIENRPALDVMAAHDGIETLHYVDPPYVPETRDKGRDYNHELSVDEHRALLVALRGLRGMVVLSGYPCDLYDDLLPDWRRVERKAWADGTRERTEVLWINPQADVKFEGARTLFCGEPS